MSLNLLRVRSARSAQSQLAVESEVAKSVEISRAGKIERLINVSIPGEEKRAAEESALAVAAEDDLAKLKDEEKQCDGSADTLDGIARRRRPILRRIEQAKEAAKHHNSALDQLHAELRRLEKEESREALETEAEQAELRGIEVVGLLVESYKHHRRLLEEFDRLYEQLGRDYAAVRDGGQGRVKNARNDAAMAIFNTPGFAPRREIALL
jgi:hypothetical protein